MHYRRLGRSGLKVSEISLGSWVTFGGQIDEAVASDLVHAAYDAGVNFFDNADIYANGQSEEVMGRAILDLPREALVLSSKVFWPTNSGPNGRGLSRKHISESVNASLRRLGTDYLDLYFCHRFDPDTPVDEVVYTMDSLARQGKILYWGTSEWRAWQVTDAIHVANLHHMLPPTAEQPQYNMFHRRRVEMELAPVCHEHGLGLMTWGPLYYGILSGKYNDGIEMGTRASMDSMAWIRDRITPERVVIVRQLTQVAQDLHISMAQLALAWLLRRKEVSTVITGATRPAQLQENLDSAEAVEKLNDDVLERIEQLLGNYPDED
ncbi:aldo/keto reductase [bacterium]|nr:aldo/keto reductase [bacterium]NCT20349.1 aldo/keto reductase [bacterium]OIO87322.1 MAG: voltage-gated potassium channel [Anaerolineae bacterium CG2_30_57_67]